MSDNAEEPVFTFVRHAGIRQPGIDHGAKVAWPEEGQPMSRRCMTAPEVLDPHLAPASCWDVVRLHTSGFELPILRSRGAQAWDR